jgi:hypothetical protein
MQAEDTLRLNMNWNGIFLSSFSTSLFYVDFRSHFSKSLFKVTFRSHFSKSLLEKLLIK